MKVGKYEFDTKEEFNIAKENVNTIKNTITFICVRKLIFQAIMPLQAIITNI